MLPSLWAVRAHMFACAGRGVDSMRGLSMAGQVWAR